MEQSVEGIPPAQPVGLGAREVPKDLRETVVGESCNLQAV